MNPDEPIIFFDGVCNLCNGAVQFIVKRDHQHVFRFTSLQSGVGQQLLKEHNYDTTGLRTIIVLSKGRIYERSDAALFIARHLKGFSWTRVLSVIPRFIRDGLYDVIATNRYRWFGKKDECMLPSPELRSRFL